MDTYMDTYEDTCKDTNKVNLVLKQPAETQSANLQVS